MEAHPWAVFRRIYCIAGHDRNEAVTARENEWRYDTGITVEQRRCACCLLSPLRSAWPLLRRRWRRKPSPWRRSTRRIERPKYTRLAATCPRRQARRTPTVTLT